ncbi:hypothetical protein VTN02DRAFT_6341 [Thermoascus thermophilus]
MLYRMRSGGRPEAKRQGRTAGSRGAARGDSIEQVQRRCRRSAVPREQDLAGRDRRPEAQAQAQRSGPGTGGWRGRKGKNERRALEAPWTRSQQRPEWRDAGYGLRGRGFEGVESVEERDVEGDGERRESSGREKRGEEASRARDRGGGGLWQSPMGRAVLFSSSFFLLFFSPLAWPCSTRRDPRERSGCDRDQRAVGSPFWDGPRRLFFLRD